MLLQLFYFFNSNMFFLYRFAINFKVADHKMSDVAFHFNPRFREQQVVRNSYVGQNWGREERSQSHFPFQPGQKFDMMIVIEQKKFKVIINRLKLHQ